MKILVFGSLNIDYVYGMPYIVRVGETLSSHNLEVFPGGKGLNQAVALSRAGAAVFLAGSVGEDGRFLLTDCLDRYGVDTRFVRVLPERTGHAVIQVDPQGQNSIFLYGGTNQKNDDAYMEEVLSQFGPGDLLLLQNEINLLPALIDRAYARGMILALNPSPFQAELASCPSDKISLLLLNEIEAEGFCGAGTLPELVSRLETRFPSSEVVLTLGSRGALCLCRGARTRHGVYRVPVTDTTAAGDTFTGYYLAARAEGIDIPEALRRASVAAALAVSRKGAAVSVPLRDEVLAARLELLPVEGENV